MSSVEFISNIGGFAIVCDGIINGRTGRSVGSRAAAANRVAVWFIVMNELRPKLRRSTSKYRIGVLFVINSTVGLSWEFRLLRRILPSASTHNPPENNSSKDSWRGQREW